MRKMVKQGYSKNYYIATGDYKIINVRMKFYNLLHNALKESYGKQKRRKRTVLLNNCVYVPLNQVLFEMEKDRYSTNLHLGAYSFIAMDCIENISIF